jgi:hypothetical protein
MLKEKNRSRFRKYERQVQAGIRLLDEIQPDWKKKINVKELDLSVNSKCPLGQIFKTYSQGAQFIEEKDPDMRGRLGYLWPFVYGFGLLLNPSVEATDEEFCKLDKQYTVLTREWIRQIKELQS